MPHFVRWERDETSIYGVKHKPAWYTGDELLVTELFATHPQASGMSTNQIGCHYWLDQVAATDLPREEFISLWVNLAPGELDEEDFALSFADLVRKYGDDPETNEYYYEEIAVGAWVDSYLSCPSVNF